MPSSLLYSPVGAFKMVNNYSVNRIENAALCYLSYYSIGTG